MLLVEVIFLFARIAMADPQMFLQLMSATAPVLKQKETYMWECLLDQWWGKVCLHNPQKRTRRI